MKVLVFLATGFEEIEAISIIDVLRRAEIDTNVVSIEKKLEVSGAHGIKIVADALIEEQQENNPVMLVLPGGMPGTTNLDNHSGLKALLKAHFEAGKSIAAICAAPLILGKLGMLKGKKVTCYPSFESYLDGANVLDATVVKDGNIITGKGPAYAIEFALALVADLKGEPLAQEVAAGLLVNV